MLKQWVRDLPRPLKDQLHVLRDGYHQTTAKWRTLPDFIIIGAMKSGTSSLFHYLTQHPGIKASATKEIHFFDWQYNKGETWYRAFFPYEGRRRGDFLTGEATPYYLFCPHTPQRIHTLIPHVKLIALLRNPTERAISHYFHSVRVGREKLPLLEALQAEEERIEEAWNAIQHSMSSNSSPLTWFTYKRRGLYIEQLQRYWRYFGREQILVESSEAFFQDPNATLSRVFDFLGVENRPHIADLSRKNKGHNRQDVPNAVYEYLDRYFQPHNTQLAEALQQEMGWGE
ncbi:MAG: sulfotransferase domain-containing protein [Anaerolineae bacterium]|nr:sulfotransferase domain-containing protein [Anaerolineae bacterium]